MNVRDLLDLRVICETGSLRAAAAVLGVSQPTLGNRVARLEDQLGAPLLDRSRGRSRPTDLARYIASRAGRLAEDAQGLVHEARRAATGRAGTVRIGLGQVALHLLTADAARPIEDTHPGRSLELVTGHTAQLSESLLRRELDMVVSAQVEAGPDLVRSELLFDAPIFVVTHPDHPLCARPPESLGEILRHPFATSVLEQHYRDLLLSRGIDFEGLEERLICSDVGMLVRAVARQPKFFAAGPRVLYATEIDAGRLRVVDFEVPFRHRIFLHTNLEAYPLPAVSQMQQTVREAFARIRAADEAARTTTDTPH